MILKKFITEYTWLLVLIAIILGFLWPSGGLELKPYLTYLLMLLMVFSVLDISISRILKQIKNFKRQLLIVLIVHLLSPLIILFFKPLLSPELFLGLILIAVSSVGLANIFLSRLYGGLSDKALLIVSWSTVLSPITIPFLTWLFAQTVVKVDPWPMVITVLKLVIIPLIIASIIRRTKYYESCKQSGTYFTITLLFIIIFSIVASVQAIIFDNLITTLWLLLLVSFLVFINFTIGYLYGRKFAEKITYALCASYKNYTLPTVLALTLFSPLVALPSTIYALVNNLMLIPLQLIFLPKVRPKRKWYYLWVK